LLQWHVGHAVQSNPVSGLFLQKMGIMPNMGGDFRDSGPKIYQIRHAETPLVVKQARERRAFLLD
jgi:hypothetical protein